jgi:ATP-dependent DNA ligase
MAIGCLPIDEGARARLISRRGLDWGWRFPTIAAAVKALAVCSCIIDGELIACDANRLADFQLLRWRNQDDPASTARLIASRSRRSSSTVTYDDPVPVVFEHACKLGCEGIVNKRRGSLYARGRSSNWLKVKNPEAPAVQREPEAAWGR